MARIDLVALQQRLVQQQPTPVPAEPPSWSTRPAPASALRTTPAPKARPAIASAAAPAGTLRATTTMRAALPLEAMNARAERAEERVRANVLRAQIDELNAEMVVARADAERALAEERQRADGLNEQVEALSAEVMRAEKQAEAAIGRAERAEAGRDAEGARAEALRAAIDELKAGQALMTDMHAAELAAAHGAAKMAEERAAALGRQRTLGGRGGCWRGSGRRCGGSSSAYRALAGAATVRVAPGFPPAAAQRRMAQRATIPAPSRDNETGSGTITPPPT
jgi:hypothetical protein